MAELPSLAAPGAPADACVDAAVAGWFRARSALVGGASTVHVRLAGVGSTFPAASVARTWKVCAAALSPL